MLSIKIKRIYQCRAGTFGTIHCNGKPFALTAELPWRDNERNLSCIPSEVYDCKRIDSPKFGNTFKIMNVENRTNILFHKGNVPEDDSDGCILIGQKFGHLTGDMAVLSSAKGFGDFMELTESVSSFELTIENHWIF